MSTNLDAQRQIELYLTEVRRTLIDESSLENDAIVEELRAHIAEKIAGRSPSTDELSRILAELGDPHEMAILPRAAPPERGRRRTLQLAIVALVLALAGTGISVGEAIAHIGPPVRAPRHFVRLPDVVSQREGLAVRRLEAAGFVVHVVQVRQCPEYESGRVVSMEPGSGQALSGNLVRIGIGKQGCTAKI